MKKVVLISEVKVQEQGRNVFTTLPATIRSMLKPKKGEILEYVIYSDSTIEIRKKEVGE